MVRCPVCKLPVAEMQTPLLAGHVAEVCRACSVVRCPELGPEWLRMGQATWASLRGKAAARETERRKEEERHVHEIRAGIERQLTAINFGD